MSAADEEPSCSNETRDLFAEFHVQPYSLSVGYEPIPDSDFTLGRYNQESYKQKLRVLRCSNYNRELSRWREFKKPLDERRLRQAVSMNDTNTVQHLLSKGISARCFDAQRRTPLHFAACRGYANLVQILLEHGADPNARDSVGNTPLHLAACTHHIDVIMKLLVAGTDANSIDRLGRNPLQLAQSKLRILIKNSKDSGKQVKEQINQVIEMLLLFSKKQEVSVDASMLETFKNNLKMTDDNTREQIDSQLNDLLDNLSSLNIDSRK